ncbi:MAG: peptide-methionine (R)-S-oxide reductase MsrB [Hyphomicrobiaceae bacterium]
MTKKVQKTKSQWREELTPEQFQITREHGTERPFTHEYNDQKDPGVYRCICCDAPLFTSKTKYDSGSGWPSFDQPANKDAVSEHEDRSLFRKRTEIRCASCEAHLGHVFPDGPETTGLRYCINGTALSFEDENQ